jgi:hypothetical protein
MRTIGTNATALSDDDLRTCIADAALSVYEAIIMRLSDYELRFALGTLWRFQDELVARCDITDAERRRNVHRCR